MTAHWLRKFEESPGVIRWGRNLLLLSKPFTLVIHNSDVSCVTTWYDLGKSEDALLKMFADLYIGYKPFWVDYMVFFDVKFGEDCWSGFDTDDSVTIKIPGFCTIDIRPSAHGSGYKGTVEVLELWDHMYVIDGEKSLKRLVEMLVAEASNMKAKLTREA